MDGGKVEAVGRGMKVSIGVSREAVVDAAARPTAVAARADARRTGMEAAAVLGAATTGMGLVAATVAVGRMGMAAMSPLPPMLERVVAGLMRTPVRGWGPEQTVTLVPLPPLPALGEPAGAGAGAPRRARVVRAELSEDAAAGSVSRR
jgi:hypothetical protein